MSEREAGHLSPEDLTIYLSGTLAGPRRDEVERHLVVCDSCRTELTAAAELGATPSTRRWIAMAVPVAAAAALAALFLVPWGGTPHSGVGVGAGSDLRGPETEGVQTFGVVEPVAGDTVVASELQFRWRTDGQDSFYRLTLTSEEGDVVWASTSPDTVLDLPAEIQLESGRRYFWFVDALLQGAQPATTGVQEFQVRR